MPTVANPFPNNGLNALSISQLNSAFANFITGINSGNHDGSDTTNGYGGAISQFGPGLSDAGGYYNLHGPGGASTDWYSAGWYNAAAIPADPALKALDPSTTTVTKSKGIAVEQMMHRGALNILAGRPATTDWGTTPFPGTLSLAQINPGSAQAGSINLDSSHSVTAGQIISTALSGTAPLIVTSGTVVANLNAAMVADITGTGHPATQLYGAGNAGSLLNLNGNGRYDAAAIDHGAGLSTTVATPITIDDDLTNIRAQLAALSAAAGEPGIWNLQAPSLVTSLSAGGATVGGAISVVPGPGMSASLTGGVLTLANSNVGPAISGALTYADLLQDGVATGLQVQFTPPATGSPTYALPADGAATMNTTFYVVFTWVGPGGLEGVPNAATTQAVTTGHDLAVTIPAFPSGVTAAKVYMGISGATGPFFLQGQTLVSGGTVTITSYNSASANPPTSNLQVWVTSGTGYITGGRQPSAGAAVTMPSGSTRYIDWNGSTFAADTTQQVAGSGWISLASATSTAVTAGLATYQSVTSVTNLSLNQPYPGEVDVRKFGVVPNAAGDQSAVMQLAINAGVPLFWPQGIYRHATGLTINLTNGIPRWRGAGIGQTIFRCTDPVNPAIMTTGDPSSTLAGTIFAGADISLGSLQGFTVDGANTANYGIILGDQANYVELEDIVVMNVTGSTGTLVVPAISFGGFSAGSSTVPTGTGIANLCRAYGSRLKNVTSTRNTNGGSFIRLCQAISFDDCYFYNNTANQITFGDGTTHLIAPMTFRGGVIEQDTSSATADLCVVSWAQVTFDSTYFEEFSPTCLTVHVTGTQRSILLFDNCLLSGTNTNPTAIKIDTTSILDFSVGTIQGYSGTTPINDVKGTSTIAWNNTMVQGTQMGRQVQIGSYLSGTDITSNIVVGKHLKTQLGLAPTLLLGLPFVGTGGIADPLPSGGGNGYAAMGTSASGGSLGTAGTSSQVYARYAFLSAALSAPAAPTNTVVGAAGTTNYWYALTYTTPRGETILGAVLNVTTGNATLSGTNYNQLAWTAPTNGCSGIRVYRSTTSGTTGFGLLTTLAATVATYNDQGAAAGAAPPGTNTATMETAATPPIPLTVPSGTAGSVTFTAITAPTNAVTINYYLSSSLNPTNTNTFLVGSGTAAAGSFPSTSFGTLPSSANQTPLATNSYVSLQTLFNSGDMSGYIEITPSPVLQVANQTTSGAAFCLYWLTTYAAQPKAFLQAAGANWLSLGGMYQLNSQFGYTTFALSTAPHGNTAYLANYLVTE